MILSIDLGSTNFKAALFDGLLNRVGESSLPSPYICNDGSCVEMDVEAVRKTIVELIKNSCKAAGIDTTSIESVAVGSQAQNFTILDENGNARCPVISWLDTRSGDEAEELWETLGVDWHEHYSFPNLNGSVQLAHLLWLHNNIPNIFEGSFNVVTLPGLVFELLAGVNLSDENLAAMNGTYSLKLRDWRLGAIEKCGVTALNMPQCVPVGEAVIVESDCKELELRKELRLVSAGNDQTAGAFGNACKGDDMIATLGTALVAYRHTGEQPGPYGKNGCWGPYPGGGYYELAFTNNGCQALDWARSVLMPDSEVKAFDAAAERAIPSIDATTGTFHAESIRTDQAWRGDFVNDDEKAYAVLEGITFDLYKLIFEDLAAPKGTSLRVVGGGSHSEIWLQLIADTLNCTVSAGDGDSLLGAAAMAAGRDVTTLKSKVFHPNSARRHLLDCRRSGGE